MPAFRSPTLPTSPSLQPTPVKEDEDILVEPPDVRLNPMPTGSLEAALPSEGRRFSNRARPSSPVAQKGISRARELIDDAIRRSEFHKIRLAPGDPSAIAGTQPRTNTIVTDENYTASQNDIAVICQGSVTITLQSTNTITGLPILVLADSGNVTIQGPVQGGSILIPSGNFLLFSFSPLSGLWSPNASSQSSSSIAAQYVSTNTTASGYSSTGVLTNIAPVTITLDAAAGIGKGSTYTIFDAGNPMNAATNAITYTPPAGMQVEDYRAPGAYLLAGASGEMNVGGGALTLQFDGTSLFKIIARV